MRCSSSSASILFSVYSVGSSVAHVAKINYCKPRLSVEELGIVLVKTSFHTRNRLSFKTQTIQKEKAVMQQIVGETISNKFNNKSLHNE